LIKSFSTQIFFFQSRQKTMILIPLDSANCGLLFGIRNKEKYIGKRSQKKNVNIPAHSMPNCLPDVRNLLEVEVQQAVALDPLVIFVLLLCSLCAHLQQVAVAAATAATTAARLLPLHFTLVVVVVVIHTRRKIEQRRPNWRCKFCRHRRFSAAERRRRLFHSAEDAAAVAARRAVDARPLSTF
jgi:hypothetical protein